MWIEVFGLSCKCTTSLFAIAFLFFLSQCQSVWTSFLFRFQLQFSCVEHDHSLYLVLVGLLHQKSCYLASLRIFCSIIMFLRPLIVADLSLSFTEGKSPANSQSCGRQIFLCFFSVQNFVISCCLWGQCLFNCLLSRFYYFRLLLRDNIAFVTFRLKIYASRS